MVLRLPLYLKLFFISTIILLFIPACTETSSEQQVRAQISLMQQAVSGKSLATFMNYFSKDFKGNKSLSRNDLRSLIYYHFKTNRTIDTYKWQADIDIKNEIALVKIHAVVTGSNNSLPERGRIYTINSSWKKIDNEWLIFKANWKDAIVD